MNRRTKLKRPLHINPEAKLLFVIRIGGLVQTSYSYSFLLLYVWVGVCVLTESCLIDSRTNDIHSQTRKILHLLRLRHIFNGVFVRANERTLDMLRKVQPYVTYGYHKTTCLLLFLYHAAFWQLNIERFCNFFYVTILFFGDIRITIARLFFFFFLLSLTKYLSWSFS